MKPDESASDDAGGLSVALDALQAEGVILEWRRFPAIGLFFLQVATEPAAVSSIFTAAQVEAFVLGSRAGLRAGRSASAAWNEVQHMASAALGQVQQLAFELRPSVLDDVGLLAAIRRLAGDIGSRHGLMIDVEAADFEVEDRVEPRIAMTAYRVVQEALTNVLRHAEARSCSIVLARHDGRLRVVVEDDGIGFDPADVRADAFGLRGMAERAGLAGGNLEIGSVPGQGTTIAMDVSL